METSTPVACHRGDTNRSLISSPTSPIGAELSDQPSDSENLLAIGATGASRELDTCQITPSKKAETSEDFEIGANALMNAAEETNAFLVEKIIQPPAAGAAEVQNINEEGVGEVLAKELNQLALSEEIQDSSGDIVHANDILDEQLIQGNKSGASQHLDEVVVEEINHMAPTGADKEVNEVKEAGEDDLLHGLNVDEWSSLEVQNSSGKSEEDECPLTPSRKSVTDPKEETKEKTFQSGYTTPVNTRRKLVFGENLTPEQGRERATPGATQVKRRVEISEGRVLKKQRLPTVVERLFMNNKAGTPSPTNLKAKRRNRTNSLPIPGQRPIREMLVKLTPGSKYDMDNINNASVVDKAESNSEGVSENDNRNDI